MTFVLLQGNRVRAGRPAKLFDVGEGDTATDVGHRVCFRQGGCLPSRHVSLQAQLETGIDLVAVFESCVVAGAAGAGVDASTGAGRGQAVYPDSDG